LVSEVFIAALSTSSRVVAHDSGSALPWLYGIALNVLRKHFQKTRPAHEVASDPGMDWDAVDDRLDAWAERGRLWAALSALSDSDRELLLLVAWEGLTPTEAAAALDISQTVARSRLHRARSRAMRALQSQPGGGPNVVTTLHARREAS
jgi:RNA polymerase sigma factor (sigma-70 family)